MAINQVPEGIRTDSSALDSFFASYYPRVYSYAFRKLGDPQSAEDLASEVTLKVVQSIDKYEPRGRPFSAWVFRIAHNKVIDLHRLRQRRREVGLTEPLSDHRIPPDVMAERALEREEILIALKRLTEPQRRVIELRFLEGFDFASVARILGRNVGAVKSLQYRALKALRYILARSGRSGYQAA